VYLKNFYSPQLGTRLYAIRKKDLKAFTPDAKSVCRIEEGSTNRYLKQDRLVEEFLKGIEPKYNRALSRLQDDDIDRECIYVIAGFIAYVLTCSPASMRIQSEPLRALVEETARTLDLSGSLPAPPPVLGGKSLTELLQKKQVLINIDPKYPQAIGISTILALTNRFGNFQWEILANHFNASPFFTSDFPIAIEKTPDPGILNRIVPLSPFAALRIRPDRSASRGPVDFTFRRFRRKHRKLSLSQVKRINQLIVRCAETTVFFRDNHTWVPKFVKKNADYRIEPETTSVPARGGNALWFRQYIAQIRDI
jgi:hypothetical protein